MYNPSSQIVLAHAGELKYSMAEAPMTSLHSEFQVPTRTGKLGKLLVKKHKRRVIKSSLLDKERDEGMCLGFHCSTSQHDLSCVTTV